MTSSIRPIILSLCIALLSAPLHTTLPHTQAHAQDMSFDAEEVLLRTHIAIIEAPRIPRKTKLHVVKTLTQQIQEFGGYEIVPKKTLRKSLGYKNFRTFSTCKQPDCFYDLASQAQVDRVLTVKLFKQDGLLTVDLTMIDLLKGKELAQKAIYIQSVKDHNWTETTQPLLSLKKELPPPLPPPDPEPAEIIDNEPPPEPSLSPVWSYATFGAGVAIVGLGAFFGSQASSTRDDLQASPKPRSDVDALIQQGEDQQLYANLSYGLGALLMGAGVTLYLLSSTEDTETHAHTPSPPESPAQTITLDPLQDGFLLRFSSPL